MKWQGVQLYPEKQGELKVFRRSVHKWEPEIEDAWALGEERGRKEKRLSFPLCTARGCHVTRLVLTGVAACSGLAGASCVRHQYVLAH